MHNLYAFTCRRALLLISLMAAAAMAFLAAHASLMAQPEGVTQAEGTAKSKPVQTPEKEAVAALNDALRRAKAKDYRGFIKHYLPVEVVRRLRNQGDYEELLASIKKNPQGFDRIEKLLELVRDGKPQFNATKTEATFREPPKKEGEPTVPKSPEVPKTTDVKLTGFGGDLGKVIDKAIAALEAGKIESFVDNMFPAGELRRPDADKRRKLILSRMTAKSAPVTQMIKDLQAIKKLTPKLEESGSVALFEVAGQALRTPAKRTFKLQKVEGSWRLYDNTTPARKEIARQAVLSVPKLGPNKGTFVKFEKLGDAWRIQEFRF